MKRIPTASSANNPRVSEYPRRRVLYVEDDASNREVARVRLAKKYELVFATNDQEACEAFVKYGQELEVVLMDIELRGSRLNGIDLTRLLREQLPEDRKPAFARAVEPLNVPVLFVTAYAQTYPRADLLAAGGDEVISKPVDFVALHTTIARVYLQRLG